MDESRRYVMFSRDSFVGNLIYLMFLSDFILECDSFLAPNFLMNFKHRFSLEIAHDFMVAF